MNNSIDKEFENVIRLPHGVSDFKKLAKGNYKFIDKTLFIRDIIYDGADVIVITRPRRFGKTLNLSMLYHFLKYQNEEEKEKEENLFKDLEISKYEAFCEEHQHQYPVIFVSFKDIKQPSYEESYDKLVVLIRRLYEEHRYLLEGDLLSETEKNTFIEILNQNAKSANLDEAIYQLSLYIHRKFKKLPIILIDEYDTPIQEAYLEKYYKKMIGSMRSILGSALKDNRQFKKAIVTGITRVSQESLFSGVNNLKVYSLLREKYGQYFGFTEKEVIKLKSETKQTVSIDKIKEWYNGYQVGKYILYNPWSIISCLDSGGALRPYWLNTSSNALVGKLLSNAGIDVKRQFEKLLQGEVIEQHISENLVFPDIEKRGSSLWSLLLYAGYLKLLSSELKGRRLMAKIAIPNREVSFVYDEIVEHWFESKISLESYDKFVQALSDGNLDKFKDYLSNYIKDTGSYFDFNKNTPEQVFHVFILGLVVGLRDHYYIYSNRELGQGRVDGILIPRDVQKKGILLEFKTADKVTQLKNQAKEALKQIKEKEYMEGFRQHKVKSALAIGIAFCGKDLELVHEEINLNKLEKGQ